MSVTGTTSGRADAVSEVTFYDYLLGAIPVPLLLGAVLASVTGVPLAYAVGAGSSISAALVAYALWGAVPTDPAGVDAGGDEAAFQPGDD